MNIINKKNGFTLIELLVVISIIALLMSIMMPGLNKARNMAKRVYCINNCHQWALAVTQYTNDYDNYFPRVKNSSNNCFFRNTWNFYVSDAQVPGKGFDLIDPFLKNYLGEVKYADCPAIKKQTNLPFDSWDEAKESAKNGYRSGCIYADYALFVGNDYSDTFSGVMYRDAEHKSEKPPLKSISTPASMAISGDNMNYYLSSRKWRYNHPDSYLVDNPPEGICSGFNDGHAEWVKFENIYELFTYTGSFVTYWPKITK
jgi:prepilin-type N-terminal cleavage/methylation domain-containing protein